MHRSHFADRVRAFLLAAALVSALICPQALAADAAENTRKRVCGKCAHYKAACVETAYTRETLGRAAGAGSLSCAAFLDAGFAEAYRQAAENDPKDPYTHRSSERKDW